MDKKIKVYVERVAMIWCATYYYCGEMCFIKADTRQQLEQKLNSRIGYNAWRYECCNIR